ncbi:thioredoxin-domain-containing protein [Bimuria novae-zelandiae CBS 107.79]|uniref:Thioredoxin-domain-containing protein n=1 Tax=Bimuria novae-zelandiae CBS 107.79 TaxID=1447943 RepID=A0A6A5V9E3_9PLEO|nr:thioredoxin-domain-containing protein [Bimuria novae-zelandiae CBS 107.79]
MPDKTIPVTSSSHFEKLTSSATYTIVDFYADWCGPCKTISPVFHALAEKESKPGRVQFVKVDVDAQQEVAKKYNVTAMPTFLVLKSTSVVETIRGANPSALTAAVRKAVQDATNGPAARGVHFQSKGYTLGSASAPSRPVGGAGGFTGGLQNMLSGDGGFGDKVVRFFALYFVSLLSFNAYQAAEESPFAVRGRRM